MCLGTLSRVNLDTSTLCAAIFYFQVSSTSRKNCISSREQQKSRNGKISVPAVSRCLRFPAGTCARREACKKAIYLRGDRATREILTLTVEGAAYVDPRSFLSTYCSETCAEPLYNYLVDCDPTGSRDNATKFDFLCSSSGDGNPCLLALVTQFTAEDSFVYECLDPLPEDSLGCTPRCQDALDSAYESLGCCLYSFYAVTAGSYGASALFRLCSVILGLSAPAAILVRQ